MDKLNRVGIKHISYFAERYSDISIDLILDNKLYVDNKTFKRIVKGNAYYYSYVKLYVKVNDTITQLSSIPIGVLQVNKSVRQLK